MGKKKAHKLFDISCGKCATYLLSYKKFGQGKGILRIYLSQITAPDTQSNILEDYEQINAVPPLSCSNCGEVLGVPDLSKSNRWIYRMKQGYFHRKLKK